MLYRFIEVLRLTCTCVTCTDPQAGRTTHTVLTILRKRAAPRPRAMWAIREEVYSKHYLLLNRSLTREAHQRVLKMGVLLIILFY